MTSWLLFPLLGLGTGAAYAAIALGVIVVHRGSGVVNFAQGALAMYPALVYVELRATGDLRLPVIGIPGRVDLGGPMALGPAILVALVVAAALGAVAHVVVFSHLHDASPLTKLIASVGFTIVLQGLALEQFGNGTRRADAILPADVVGIFGRPAPQDRFWLTAVVVAAGIAIAVVYRRTRFGLATRAAAGNPKGVVLLGWSPWVLGIVNWVAAATLAGLVGVLMTPISGVNPFNYSFFVVPALAAALAARLRSFSVAVAVGLGLGMFEALAVHVVSRRLVPDLLLGGFDTVVPFALIIGVLLLAGRTVPDRGVLLDDRQPDAPRPRRPVASLAVVGAVGLVVMTWGDSGLRLAATETMVVTTLILSIVVLTGFVGQVSLAQLSFAGFAAFMLSRFATRWELPFPWSPLLAIVVTTAVGTLIGVPALRIRGIQFAIVTLAAAVAIEQVLFRSPAFTGLGGSAHVDAPDLAGVDLGIIGPGEYPYRGFGYLCLGVTLGCALLVLNVRRSAVGRRFLAVRANERAAAAVGIDVPRTKLLGAAVASFLAAVSGVLFAYKNVDFSQVGLEAQRGLQVLALAYLGGVGSVAGALIGGILAPAGVLSELRGGGSSAVQFLLSGVGMIVVALRFPGGIAAAGPWLGRHLRRWTSPPARAPRGSPVATPLRMVEVDADDP